MSKIVKIQGAAPAAANTITFVPTRPDAQLFLQYMRPEHGDGIQAFQIIQREKGCDDEIQGYIPHAWAVTLERDK